MVVCEWPIGGYTRIPIGTGYIVGRDNITVNWQNFFATLSSIDEIITSPLIVNNNFGSFSKVIIRYPKSCLPV
jgi:hypothetical protein